MNHPLAGKILNFEVEIDSISKKWKGNIQKHTVESGDSIQVHYVGTLENGELFDSSRERGETLPFTVGAKQMIAWFDAWVIEMNVWETKTLTIIPREAYGEYDATKIQNVPKADLQSFVAAGYKLEKWEKLPTQMGELEIIDVID
jgi:FKBP-type peptidyl-prolyl cis-trans isomerase 2